MLKSTGIIRTVDELGRIVLPSEARSVLGIQEKDGLEVFVDKRQRHIVLKKPVPVCLKCRSTENLKTVCDGYYLCKSCIDQLK